MIPLTDLIEMRTMALTVPCREASGSRRNGYGRVYLGSNGGRSIYVSAHRWAWERANGPIPEGLEVCHHCDNKPCIEVRHLFLGTGMDNARDRWSKGRRGDLYDVGRENRTKTMCEAGHPFDAENTYYRPDRPGARLCRACNRASATRYREKRRAHG